MCGRTATDEGRAKDRAACRCSLPGFDPATWDPSASPGAAAEAEIKAQTVAMLADAQNVPLDFELARDGCPWGWVVSRFATSVMAYVGRRDPESVVRGQNTRLLARLLRDPEEPTRLLELVSYAEHFEDAAYAHYWEVKGSG